MQKSRPSKALLTAGKVLMKFYDKNVYDSSFEGHK